MNLSCLALVPLGDGWLVRCMLRDGHQGDHFDGSTLWWDGDEDFGFQTSDDPIDDGDRTPETQEWL